MPARRASPLLVADTTTARDLPRRDLWRDGHSVGVSQGATSVALWTLRVTRESEVEEVVTHLAAASGADDCGPIHELAVTYRRVDRVDVEAVACGEPAQTDGPVASGADALRVEQDARCGSVGRLSVDVRPVRRQANSRAGLGRLEPFRPGRRLYRYPRSTDGCGRSSRACQAP